MAHISKPGPGAIRRDPPAHADVVVIGGGAGGAPAAARLAERSGASVLLLEAGPDYGPYAGGAWPADIVDARTIPLSHDWGYTSEDVIPGRQIPYERARVLGGCTAHNGAIQIRGHRRDYDHWVELGNPGWETEGMLARFLEIEQALGIWTYPHEALTPFQAAFLEAAPSAGLPLLETINDLDEAAGAAPETVNIRDGARWNTAFAFLDPARALPNLTICGETIVDRLEVRDGRVAAVRAIGPDGPRTIEAGRVLLGAGAYGTPAILQRSGVGPAALLREHGIAQALESPVGAGLFDQPSLSIELSGTEELQRRMEAFAAERGWAPDEQVIMKAPSAVEREAFDLHVFPWSPPDPDTGRRRWYLAGACLTPRSRGTLAIRGRDPERQPRIDNAFLSDPEGHDLGALRSLVGLFRELCAQPAVRDLLGEEVGASAAARDDAAVEDFIRANVSHYWHPMGSCRMGPDGDAGAVCTPRGLVRGLENAYVVDTSLMPTAPRGFPMLPTIAIAGQVADWIMEEER